MTSRDFCYWLQGYFEIRNNKNQNITKEQSKMIQRHLNMVFKHEIDPSMGNKKHQNKLKEIHYCNKKQRKAERKPFSIHDTMIYTC